MTDQKSFIIYKDSLSIRKKLNIEQKASLFDAIADYQIDGKLPEDNLISIIFEPFLNQFIRDKEKWEKVREARALAGAKGGKQKVANASKSKQKVANLAVSVNDSVSVNVNDNVNKNKKPKGFIAPTLEEVKNYCQERNNTVNPQKFFDYYNAGNWKDGKGKPVKNWKQKLINWEDGESKPKTQDPAAEVNKILNQDLILKIEKNGSTAKLYFKTEKDFEILKTHKKKEEVKELITKELSINNFEFSF